MTNELTIHAYSRYRPCEARDIVVRLLKTLASIGECAEWLSSWNMVGNSRADAARSKLVSCGQILPGAVESLAAGIRPDEYDLIRAVWNGGEGDKGCQLILAHQLRPSRLPSSIGLRFPERGGPGSTDVQLVRSVMLVLVRLWTPDWAIVTSPQLRDAMRTAPDAPTLGWLTYFSSRMGMIPDLAGADVIRSFAGQGTLVLACSRLPDATRQDDMDRLRGVLAELQNAGILSA